MSDEMRLFLKDLGFTESQIMLLAKHTSHVLKAEYTVGQRLDEIKSVADEVEFDDDTIHTVTEAVIEEVEEYVQLHTHLTTLSSGNYTVHTVDVGGGIPNFAYTIGLSFMVGFELIFIAKTDLSLIIKVISALADKAQDGLAVLGPNEIATITMDDGASRRFYVKERGVDVSINQWASLLNRLDYMVTPPERILQIYMGDSNNILPGEVGYDMTFLQPRSDRPVDHFE